MSRHTVHSIQGTQGANRKQASPDGVDDAPPMHAVRMSFEHAVKGLEDGIAARDYFAANYWAGRAQFNQLAVAPHLGVGVAGSTEEQAELEQLRALQRRFERSKAIAPDGGEPSKAGKDAWLAQMGGGEQSTPAAAESTPNPFPFRVENLDAGPSAFSVGTALLIGPLGTLWIEQERRSHDPIQRHLGEFAHDLTQQPEFLISFIGGNGKGMQRAILDFVSAVPDAIRFMADVEGAMLTRGGFGLAMKLFHEIEKLVGAVPGLVRAAPALGAWFVGKWNALDLEARGEFRGEVVGYGITMVSLAIIAAYAGQLAPLAGEFAVVIRLIEAIDMAGDITTLLRPLGLVGKGAHAAGQAAKGAHAARDGARTAGEVAHLAGEAAHDAAIVGRAAHRADSVSELATTAAHSLDRATPDVHALDHSVAATPVELSAPAAHAGDHSGPAAHAGDHSGPAAHTAEQAAPDAPALHAGTPDVSRLDTLAAQLPSDLRHRVPIVENPDLPGTTVHVVYRDGTVRIEVGPDAQPRHVGYHVATARLATRYQGPLGYARRLLDAILTKLRLTPGFGTEGFEARAEVKKLRAMQRDLEGLRGQLGAQVDALSSTHTDAATVERELVDVQDQLDRHAVALDSYEPGRGFIAAEDLTEVTVRKADLRMVVEEGGDNIFLRFQATDDAPLRDQLGSARIPLDEAGLPTDGPHLSLDNRVGDTHMTVLDEDGGRISMTAHALDRSIEFFRRRFGHPPDTLPGHLAWKNLENFQREFSLHRARGMTSHAAAQEAIRNISFGRHRMARGYTSFDVDFGDLTTVTLPDGTLLPAVPSSVDVIASRS